MSTLLQLIQAQLSDSHIEALGESAGMNATQARGAIAEALPLLVGALAQRATANTGAEFLTSLLDKNHDGSVLDDVLGMVLGGSGATPNRQALTSILGDHLPALEQRVAAQSGVSPEVVGKLLPLLAPVVLGSLAKAQVSGGLEGQGLSAFLEKERSSISRQTPDSEGFLGSLLDQNHDGSVVDDVLRIGGQVLKNLIK